jgi:GntR family transcriptional regulator
MLERIRGTKNKPIVYFVSYFHPRIGLKLNSDFSKPLYKLLEEEYSVFASVSKEEIRAVNADKEMAARLQIEIGNPILLRKRIVQDPGGRIIEYNTGYYRADSFTYIIDIVRGK